MSARSYCNVGGHWYRIVPSRSPRSPARSRKARTSSSTSVSRFQCVIRWFAFSVKRNDSGVSALQVVSDFSVGYRRNV